MLFREKTKKKAKPKSRKKAVKKTKRKPVKRKAVKRAKPKIKKKVRPKVRKKVRKTRPEVKRKVRKAHKVKRVKKKVVKKKPEVVEKVKEKAVGPAKKVKVEKPVKPVPVTVEKPVEVPKPAPELTGKIAFKIENIVASANLKVELDLYAIAREVDNVEYEPEQFPGAILKLKDPKTSLLLFKNGKLICTGAKSADEVDRAIHKAYNSIKHCIRR